MKAIRQTVEVKNHTIKIDLPEGFDAEIVEVIILPKEEEINFQVPDSFYEEMEKRRQRHLNGESKSYTWEEEKALVLDRIKNSNIEDAKQ